MCLAQCDNQAPDKRHKGRSGSGPENHCHTAPPRRAPVPDTDAEAAAPPSSAHPGLPRPGPARGDLRVTARAALCAGVWGLPRGPPVSERVRGRRATLSIPEANLRSLRFSLSRAARRPSPPLPHSPGRRAVGVRAAAPGGSLRAANC